MSLQSIIDRCTGISIDRRKMVGIQYTRNQIPRISQTPTMNPWRFTIDMPTSLKYSDARAIMESIDSLDRVNPETITFNNTPAMSWIWRYQGSAPISSLSNLRVVSFIGNQLTLDTLPVMGATRAIFEPNDLIQIGNFPYPFTSTTQVLRGTGSQVVVTTNRPNILTNDVVGLGLTVGPSCQFRVFCPNMPTYKLFPGGGTYQNGVLINNAYIEWSDAFNLYEYVGTA